MRRRDLVGVGLAALCCLGAPAVAFDDSRVSALAIAGLMNLPDAGLKDLLKLKPGAAFTPEQLEADRKRLLETGYFRSVSAGQRTTDGKTTVTFNVVEWPVVAHVRVLGNTLLPLRKLQGAITTRVGQVLCSRQLQSDISAIERLYREQGYVARVSDRLLDEATRSGILRFEILELRVADVRFDGASPALQERARKVLAQTTGEFYRPEAVAQDRKRLLEVRGITAAAARVEAAEPGLVRIRWMLNDSAAGKQEMDRPPSD